MGVNASRAATDRWPRPDLVVATIALALAFALALVVNALGNTPSNQTLPSALGYLVFWLPLLAAAVLIRSRGWNGPRPVRWRLKLIDLLWGIGVGLLLRMAASIAELAMRNTVIAPSFLLPAGVNGVDLATLAFVSLVAPLLIAPLVEELFFRGTLLGSFVPPGGKPTGAILAVVMSSLLFALPHAIASATISDGASRFIAAGILGLGAGALTVATGRIGAAIVAHITFNAALFLLLLG